MDQQQKKIVASALATAFNEENILSILQGIDVFPQKGIFIDPPKLQKGFDQTLNSAKTKVNEEPSTSQQFESWPDGKTWEYEGNTYSLGEMKDIPEDAWN